VWLFHLYAAKWIENCAAIYKEIKYEFTHPTYHKVNVNGCAHVRVVQMNHTHSGVSKYSCLQAKYMSKRMKKQQLNHGLCNQTGTSQQMGTVRQIQMLKIQVQNPSEQSQASAQTIVCSINGLLIYHWGSTS
jgi:hypothetical protein